jgi:hypothetical protein
VHDDVADVAVVLDTSQQPLELWPVRGAGALAPVDELLLDNDTQKA